MSGLPPEVDEKNLPKESKLRNRLKIYQSRISRDSWRGVKSFFTLRLFEQLQFFVVPAVVVLMVVAVMFLEGANERTKEADMYMVRVENPAISLVYDVDKEGNVVSAWLRTPKTSRRIGQLDGLAYIADSKFYSDVDGDGKKDLLWRISFNNEKERSGVHLWIGALSGLAKIYVCSSPYQYTRWDAIPAKIRTPQSCALYVSPGIPGTDFEGKGCYSFIYTIKLTAEGPAFVPVADVYKQLIPILRAAADAKQSAELHKAYIKMLTEFRNLAAGEVPSAASLTALQMNSVDLIPLK